MSARQVDRVVVSDFSRRRLDQALVDVLGDDGTGCAVLSDQLPELFLLVQVEALWKRKRLQRTDTGCRIQLGEEAYLEEHRADVLLVLALRDLAILVGRVEEIVQALLSRRRSVSIRARFRISGAHGAAAVGRIRRLLGLSTRERVVLEVDDQVGELLVRLGRGGGGVELGRFGRVVERSHRRLVVVAAEEAVAGRRGLGGTVQSPVRGAESGRLELEAAGRVA